MFFGSLFFLALLISLPFYTLGSKLEKGESIPIHYNIYFGIDNYGSWEKLFFLPLLGFLFLMINLFFYFSLIRKYRLLGAFLALGTIVVEMIFSFSLGFILLMNL
jgi:hypothetical protein